MFWLFFTKMYIAFPLHEKQAPLHDDTSFIPNAVNRGLWFDHSTVYTRPIYHAVGSAQRPFA